MLLTTIPALLLAALAPPVLAQEPTQAGSQEALAAEPGAPPPPAYTVTPDGRIVVGGDVVIDCEPAPPDFAELCARRDSLPPSGSVPPGGTQSVAGPASSGGPAATTEAKTNSEEKKDKELPNTGGASLLVLGVGALVASGGLLVRKIGR